MAVALLSSLAYIASMSFLRWNFQCCCHVVSSLAFSVCSGAPCFVYSNLCCRVVKESIQDDCLCYVMGQQMTWYSAIHFAISLLCCFFHAWVFLSWYLALINGVCYFDFLLCRICVCMSTVSNVQPFRLFVCWSLGVVNWYGNTNQNQCFGFKR